MIKTGAKTFEHTSWRNRKAFSSILDLKKGDIQYLENRMILSLKTKRNKQRFLTEPSSAEVLLKELIQNKKEDEYFLVGRNQGNKPLSRSSASAPLRHLLSRKNRKVI